MKDLTKGNVAKNIISFAIPLLLGNLFQQMYNIVDSIIVGQYIGKEALAAVGSSFPIIFTLISFVIGLAGGFTIIISQYFGAKQIDNVRKTIETMYICMFFAAIFLTVVGIVFVKEIFIIMQTPEDVLPQAVSYLRIYFTGFIFFFGFSSINAILRGLGDSKTPLYFLIISTLTNIIFDYLLIVVWNMGIEGAAIATIISQAGAFITVMIYLNRRHSLVRVNSLHLKFDYAIFKKSLKIGLPTGFQHTFVSLSLMALFGIVNTFGTVASAAYSAVLKIDAIASTPATNIAIALSTFVGQNIGANQLKRIKKGLSASLIISLIITSLLSLIIIWQKSNLIRLFSHDEAVIRIGGEYLVIIGVFYLIFSTMFIFNGVMRGAGDTLIPMFITLISLWVIRIPLALLLSQRMGITGIWWATPFAWLFGMVMSMLYYFSNKWKEKGIIKYQKQS